MRAAAQAYGLRWQTHAYGIGARNHFRSPTHVFLRKPELLRMNDNNQSDDVIHLSRVRFIHACAILSIGTPLPPRVAFYGRRALYGGRINGKTGAARAGI